MTLRGLLRVIIVGALPCAYLLLAGITFAAQADGVRVSWEFVGPFLVIVGVAFFTFTALLAVATMPPTPAPYISDKTDEVYEKEPVAVEPEITVIIVPIHPEPRPRPEEQKLLIAAVAAAVGELLAYLFFKNRNNK